MGRHIGFLRAVNVGRRRVGMSRVVEICGDLGYQDAWTLANSGNVVFTASGARGTIERALGEAFERAFGFEVTTFVRSPAELRAALRLEPFKIDAGDTYFITFLKDPLPAATAAAMEGASNDFDTLVVDGREIHWRMRGKSTDTTLKAWTWNQVGQQGSTSRNVTMLRKIAAKLGDE